jgi:signal transduction histidine kinase
VTDTAPERARSVALAVTLALAGVLLALDGVELVELRWGWTLALVSVSAGIALIATGPPSRTLFVGAIARFAPTTRSLWTLRVATVVTAPAAGIGPALYAMLSLAQAISQPRPLDASPDWRHALGTGLIGLGFVLAAAEAGLTFPDEDVLWAVLLGSTALSAFWWLSGPSRAARRSLAAVAALVLLVWGALGPGISGAGNGGGGDADQVVLAGIAGVLLATIVFGPRLIRRSRAAAEERARLARIDERAEVAGAVHDSVLQTLALIQSRADDPAEVRALARAQERDLRARLFAEAGPNGQPTSIAAALRAVAAEIEDAHRVKIDIVTVGDAPLDERSTALVAAAREALLNSVRHAPGAPLSLFAEVDDGRVAAYVRDRGPGFDLDDIPEDRRGVTESIVARMVRHGGHAAVRTAPGGGCEVQLVLERRR